MIKLFFLAYLIFLLSVAAIAHPGHGETDGFTITHYLVEPIHVVIAISVLFISVVAAKWIKRKRKLS